MKHSMKEGLVSSEDRQIRDEGRFQEVRSVLSLLLRVRKTAGQNREN